MYFVLRGESQCTLRNCIEAKMQLMHQSTNQALSFSYSFDGILIVFLITEGTLSLLINFFKAAANSKELPSVELELGDLNKDEFL